MAHFGDFSFTVTDGRTDGKSLFSICDDAFEKHEVNGRQTDGLDLKWKHITGSRKELITEDKA